MTAAAIVVAGVAVFAFSRTAAVEAVYPLERLSLAVSRHVLSRARGLFRGASAQSENVRLRREVAALRLAQEAHSHVEAENARLRAALGYARRVGESWIPAAVLSQDGAAVGSHATVRIGKGALSGVREGAVVMVPDGLVGKVTSVTPHTAEVTVLTDPSVMVSCEVVGSGRRLLRGILSGGSGDMLALRHLTAGVVPAAGARVLTSGLGGVFPRGLPVGSFLRFRDAGLSREAQVVPFVDFDALEDVFVRREE